MTEAVETKHQRYAAILLKSLPPEISAKVLRAMPSNAEELASNIMNLKSIGVEELTAALDLMHEEFETLAAAGGMDSQDLLQMLTLAYGEEKAEAIFSEIINEQKGITGFEKLNMMDAASVAEFIRDEHPQIIATIICYLDPKLSGAVLSLFETSFREDILFRVADIGSVNSQALAELTESIEARLSGQNVKRAKLGGPSTAAAILNTMATSEETSALDTIRAQDAELAEAIENEMFLFENLLELDDRSIQKLITEINPDSLCVALKGADEDLVGKFIKNMANRQAELLRDDMESRGPVRLSQVEQEQKSILEIVRRLQAAGEIVISSGDDEFV
ncbi:flagellar motor switch protein FliG [Pseudomonas aeruginosa]